VTLPDRLSKVLDCLDGNEQSTAEIATLLFANWFELASLPLITGRLRELERWGLASRRPVNDPTGGTMYLWRRIEQEETE